MLLLKRQKLSYKYSFNSDYPEFTFKHTRHIYVILAVHLEGSNNKLLGITEDLIKNKELDNIFSIIDYHPEVAFQKKHDFVN